MSIIITDKTISKISIGGKEAARIYINNKLAYENGGQPTPVIPWYFDDSDVSYNQTLPNGWHASTDMVATYNSLRETWNKRFYYKFQSDYFDEGFNGDITFHGFFRDGAYNDDYHNVFKIGIMIYDENGALVDFREQDIKSIEEYGGDTSDSKYHTAQSDTGKYVPNTMEQAYNTFTELSEYTPNTFSNVTIPVGGRFEIKFNIYKNWDDFHTSSWLIIDTVVYGNGEQVPGVVPYPTGVYARQDSYYLLLTGDEDIWRDDECLITYADYNGTPVNGWIQKISSSNREAAINIHTMINAGITINYESFEDVMNITFKSSKTGTTTIQQNPYIDAPHEDLYLHPLTTYEKMVERGDWNYYYVTGYTNSEVNQYNISDFVEIGGYVTRLNVTCEENSDTEYKYKVTAGYYVSPGGTMYSLSVYKNTWLETQRITQSSLYGLYNTDNITELVLGENTITTAPDSTEYNRINYSNDVWKAYTFNATQDGMLHVIAEPTSTSKIGWMHGANNNTMITSSNNGSASELRLIVKKDEKYIIFVGTSSYDEPATSILTLSM